MSNGSERGSTSFVTVKQATVRLFDPQTQSGTVLLDDGTEAAYDGDAFAAGGLRLLRLGQRVRMSVNDEGRITALTLVTLPLVTATQ